MHAKHNTQPRLCACGCGGQPAGGEFLPGHDAKLRSKYLARIDEGERKAIYEFLDRWPSLAFPYGYTEAKLLDRLGRGPKTKK